MSVSQKQLAAHLGLTPITISRALNDHPAVALKTRRRIREAAHQLGYGGPTTWGAQALAAKRYNRRMPTGVLAVLVTADYDLPYFEELLRGLKRGCLINDLSILISPIPDNGLPKMVEQGRVDGIFLIMPVGEARAKINKLNLPVLTLGFRNYIEGDLSVLPDNRQGGYLATKHLLDLGHRKIAHISYRYYDPEMQERQKGYEAALAEAGVALRNDLMCKSVQQTRVYEFEKILDHLLTTAPDLTAISCYNDWFAMLTIEALGKRGLRVPDDISVVGFDDLSEASHYSPAISSVHYDRAQMGENAVQLLTRQAGGTSEPCLDVLPVSFVQRETTRQIDID